MNDGYSWIGWILVIGIIWGGYSFFSNDKSKDGYTWAKENDVTTFEECQDQYGTGDEEDECNQYVKDNHSGYKTFRGKKCTEDCSGHQAGYNWAKKKNISDANDCDGTSNSFIEGCISFVEENN